MLESVVDETKSIVGNQRAADRIAHRANRSPEAIRLIGIQPLDGVELGIAHRREQLWIEIVDEIVLSIETSEVIIRVLCGFTGLKATT